MKKSNIEKIVSHIDGTMALEDMTLTKEDKQRIEKIHSGQSTVQEEIQKLNEKYKTS